LAIACVIVFKLWLVRGEDIVGSATQYDALWYVRSASYWYWGAPYDWTAFLRPCAYPLWIALVHWLHLPLRLAIELLQIGGGLTLLAGFRSLGVNRWVCVASFFVLCLHPIGFQQNDYSMSDTFYAAVLWYILGGLLLTVATRSWWCAAGTGIALAVLWNAREEGILVVALSALWAVLFFLRERGASARPIAIASGTAIILITLVYATNDRVFRSFARSEMTAPAYQALYHSLLRIKPTEPKPYAPITMDTLHRAFTVSPTFATLRGPIDGPLGEAWRVETMRRTGTPNEIGVGWIIWATRQAASAEGIFASPRTARRFFTRAAREINAACDDGRLPTRFVLDGFLDPFVQSGGLRRLPASAGRMVARIFAQWPIKSLRRDDTILTKDESRLYDEMTLRKSPEMKSHRDKKSLFVERLIGRYHWVAMVLLHTFAAAALVCLFFSRKRMREHRGITCAIALLAGAVFLRAALLTWLDATAFDGTQDRFLFPVLPLWSVVLVLVIALGAEAMRRIRTPATDER
jgi:hypothetical protein